MKKVSNWKWISRNKEVIPVLLMAFVGIIIGTVVGVFKSFFMLNLMFDLNLPTDFNSCAIIGGCISAAIIFWFLFIKKVESF